MYSSHEKLFARKKIFSYPISWLNLYYVLRSITKSTCNFCFKIIPFYWSHMNPCLILTIWLLHFRNPTPTSSDLVPVIWEAVGSDSRPYLAIESSGVYLEHRFRKRSTAFWDLFYKVYGQYHQQTRSCKCSGKCTVNWMFLNNISENGV